MRSHSIVIASILSQGPAQMRLAQHDDMVHALPKFRLVDRDLVFIMSAYLIDAGTYLPKVAEMTDF
jgi:hypothetical protein